MVHVQFKIDNMNMKKYKLGDLLSEFHAGKAIQTENVKNKGAYPVYGGNGQRGYTDSYNQDGEYLIIGRQGAYCGNVRYNIGKAYLTEHAIVGQAKENHNPIYIALKLSLMKLSQLQGQSAQPGLSVNTLSCISMEMPPKEIQDKIADIMLKLDRKIELNKQINDNLEAMAKQLYDYWFVQFDFPNEEGKPYKSSGGAMVWNEKLKREIPTSFDVKSLSEIIEVKDGTHDSPKPQDNGYFLLTSKHLTERGLDYASAYKISKEDYESINKRSKVDTNDILFSMIGTIGNSYFVEETKINFAIKNMALFKTSAKRWFSEYMYLYLSSCDYKHYEGNSLSGSIQKFVSLRTLRDMPILYHEDIIKVFAKEVRNIITMMVNLRKENIELTKQRDELLPLLMNGQASVNSD